MIPGWVFAYSDAECRKIPAQHYALFNHPHEPCFTWPQEPVESAEDKHGREAAFQWADNDPLSIQEDRHINNVLGMEEHFKCDIMTGYHLVSACKDAGYSQQNSGMPLFWLANRMARLINKEDL